MGVKERQEREREATSRAILDAARELFVAEGYQNVSIRKVAEKIEYSPAAIYSYFPSKDDIFLALAEEGFHLLFELAECSRQEHSHADPIDCIRSGFLTMYEFSKAYPQHFSLMFVDRSVPRIMEEWQRFGFVREMRAQFIDLIRQAIADGIFPGDCNPEVVFRVLMVATQGISVMRISDRLLPGEDADALARTAIDAALTGLRTGFPHAYRPEAFL